MWVLLFLFLLQTNPNPCEALPAQAQSPSLIVQVVDPDWLPVPGAQVTVEPLASDQKTKSSRTETDKDGYAKFSVSGDADYAIHVELYGFKRESLEHVHLFKTSSSSVPAYVQLKLRLSGPGTMVH
ncbi:MAG: carboxypeptidase-like regulatory domain-containing protein [Candidatus Acidiferrales bacterium]